MSTRSLKPNEAFEKLFAWCKIHDGFGLSWVFGRDSVGIRWLQQRLEEEIRHRPWTNAPAFITLEPKNPTEFFGAIQNKDQHCLFWVYPLLDEHKPTDWLARLNEQRQRLIASGHLFVLAFLLENENEATLRAPDLWSVRSLAFITKGKYYSLDERPSSVPPNSILDDMYRYNISTSVNIERWSQSWAAWKTGGSTQKKYPAPTLALRASRDAIAMGSLDRAREILNQAIESTSSINDSLGRANTLKSLGDLENRLGRIDEARSLYEQAIGLYGKEQDDLGRANALRSLGDLERRLGRIDEARSLYEQAIELYGKEQDDLG
ncbi:MAG: tetratricopeptide repeat protein, partial [Campylobacterales bacterium]